MIFIYVFMQMLLCIAFRIYILYNQSKRRSHESNNDEIHYHEWPVDGAVTQINTQMITWPQKMFGFHSVLGSVCRTSLTQLAGFDCWWFRLILDDLVLRSSSWSCCHSNRSVSLNLLGSSLFHVNRIRLYLFKQNWYLISAPANATLLQEYPTGPGTII